MRLSYNGGMNNHLREKLTDHATSLETAVDRISDFAGTQLIKEAIEYTNSEKRDSLPIINQIRSMFAELIEDSEGVTSHLQHELNLLLAAKYLVMATDTLIDYQWHEKRVASSALSPGYHEDRFGQLLNECRSRIETGC